jgi:hypothetical protein
MEVENMKIITEPTNNVNGFMKRVSQRLRSSVKIKTVEPISIPSLIWA